MLATLVLAPMSAQAQIEPYAPGVESITVTTGGTDGYGIGEYIEFKVQFSDFASDALILDYWTITR